MPLVPVLYVFTVLFMSLSTGKNCNGKQNVDRLSLETDQDHFFEVLVLVSTLLVLVLVLASLVLVSVLVSACLVLVLVLVSEGGLEQDLRLCATATLLVSKVDTSN